MADRDPTSVERTSMLASAYKRRAMVLGAAERVAEGDSREE
jgi:hypothetical protein